MIIYNLYCDSCDASYRVYLELPHEPGYCVGCGHAVNFDNCDKTEEEKDDKEEEYYEYFDEDSASSEGEW